MIDDTKAFSRVAQNPVSGSRDIDPVESPYILPNTVNESSRLNFQHIIMQHYLKTNTVAPIGHAHQISSASDSWTGLVLNQFLQHSSTSAMPTPKRILDVGCGTGRWAIELARQFPNAHVIGVDIVEPARPYADALPLPANFSFFRADLLRGLSSFSDGTFDYVHMRFLSFGIPGEHWQAVVNELARLTAPAGWIEIIDYTLPTNAGPTITQASEILGNALMLRGIDLTRSRLIDSFLRQARHPLMAISSQLLEMPLGAYGGALSRRMAWNLIFAFTNLQAYFLQTGLVAADDWAKLVHNIEREASNPNYQPKFPLYITIGQRKAEASGKIER